MSAEKADIFFLVYDHDEFVSYLCSSPAMRRLSMWSTKWRPCAVTSFAQCGPAERVTRLLPLACRQA
jgi:hypothetical protein